MGATAELFLHQIHAKANNAMRLTIFISPYNTYMCETAKSFVLSTLQGRVKLMVKRGPSAGTARVGEASSKSNHKGSDAHGL